MKKETEKKNEKKIQIEQNTYTQREIKREIEEINSTLNNKVAEKAMYSVR